MFECYRVGSYFWLFLHSPAIKVEVDITQPELTNDNPTIPFSTLE